MRKGKQHDNYRLLIDKLEEFIRKYYKNLALRGLIYSSALLFISFLVVSIIEHIGHFSIAVRTVLFYAFLLINAAFLIKVVLLPLLKLWSIGKRLSHEKAAKIVGDHFPGVKDKLLNTLQLKRMADTQDAETQRSLILASVNQKISDLRPVRFSLAIRLGENKKYFKYALPPLVIIFLILISSPDILVESTARLITHRKYYEVKAPFQFQLQNKDLKAVRQEDFKVKLKISGEEIPNSVYIKVDGQQFRMNKSGKTHFNYTFYNLQKDFELQFWANGFLSRPYKVKVLPKPLLQSFSVTLDYPGYTGKKTTTLQNIGDLTVPAGTRVQWKFHTQNTQRVKMVFNDTVFTPSRVAVDQFDFQKTFLNNDHYYVKTANQYLHGKDSILYYISVIPDAYPNIRVKQEKDTSTTKLLYFTGEISDDYGFNKLTFNYSFQGRSGKDTGTGSYTKKLDISGSKMLQNFYHTWDLKQVNIQPGDRIEYFFEVWDNDQVNGSKSTRSRILVFEAPTREELNEDLEKTHENINNQLAETRQRVKKLQDRIDKARKMILDKKNLSWEDKKFIKETIRMQKELQRSIEKLHKKYRKTLQKQSDYKNLSPENKEKLEKLNRLLDDMITDEMKKMLRELQKLLEKENQRNIGKELEKLKKEEMNFEKELERSMELFKRMEFEQKYENLVEKLKKLSEKQKELAEKTRKTQDKDSLEKIQKKQEELNKEFEKVQKDLKELKKLNKDLEFPFEMEETEKEEEEIKKEQQQSLDNLKNQRQQDASGNQQNASKKMKKLSKKMQQMMSQMQQKSLMLNYQKLRQILENLVYLSFEQENLMEEFEKIHSYNPRFVEMAARQSRLEEDARMIEDSILSLSKRVIQIKSFVNRQIRDINYYMDKTKQHLSNRNIPKVRESQQYIMTATNNLAVMLSEIMDQMQKKLASTMKGKRMCIGNAPMPGSKNGKKGKIGHIKKLQKEMGEKMKEMLKKKRSGNNGPTSKELAQMAAFQEKIRQMLNELKERMNKEGKPGDQLNKAEELMKENEKDIVNKKLSEKLKKRQEEINVRLLEFEKAARKQGWDKERKSKTAENRKKENPPSLEEYQKAKKQEVELLQTVPPTLNGYYRLKVKEYFKKIQ